ncbi:VOC family protein [Spiroplasma culicicola]|uniref:VOC domain-containing protein n=1 Tax=Spiroplasma culicicola AES-1 TaxID=1276246 RepID=W6AHQ1_9MOLU|nr:hypothetical protein [Spiroplasma culicicola]AHI53209.1 hypothetical protein SCULI_v1c08690 [Spiroplasma culicicola AES-1]
MINHIEIYILDYKKELNFWQKLAPILQLPIIDTWITGFRVGNLLTGYIAFNETKINTINFKRTNVGINHLAFKVNSSKEEIYQKLKNQNFKILYLDKNYPNVYVENEWGLKIEIITVDK